MKVAIETPPRKLELDRYVDFDEEAAKFELTGPRVAEIAKEVERTSPPTLTITQTHRESELRERLQAIYNENLEQWRSCNWDGCRHRFRDVHDFVIHQRMHLAVEAPDHKIRRLVLKDIEQSIVPVIEKSMTAEGVLTPEERQRIEAAISARLDSGNHNPRRQNK